MSDEQAVETAWRRNPGGLGGTNYVLTGDGFFISYNPMVAPGFSVFAADDDSPETALCKGGTYYILNGDFRDEYERLLPQGFDVCLAFFLVNKGEHGSSWSTKTAR